MSLQLERKTSIKYFVDSVQHVAQILLRELPSLLQTHLEQIKYQQFLSGNYHSLYVTHISP